MSAPCPSFAFTVTMAPRDDVSTAERDAMVLEFVELAELYDLTAWPGGVGAVLEYVVRREGSQATDADRRVVRDWSRRWAARATIVVGDLVDVSHRD
jgi:uncharacterized protein YggL (DUF469 family)